MPLQQGRSRAPREEPPGARGGFSGPPIARLAQGRRVGGVVGGRGPNALVVINFRRKSAEATRSVKGLTPVSSLFERTPVSSLLQRFCLLVSTPIVGTAPVGSSFITRSLVENFDATPPSVFPRSATALQHVPLGEQGEARAAPAARVVAGARPRRAPRDHRQLLCVARSNRSRFG